MKEIIEKDGTKHEIILGDCIEVMKKLPKDYIDLIITDPPYNVGLKYSKYKDKKSKESYIKWCKEWLTECKRILKSNGSLYLINYPENNAYLMPVLDNELGLIFRRWLTWHYPTNTGHSKKNFTRTQRSILFYTKSKNYKFHRTNIIQHYKNPEVSKIKIRIKNGKRGRGSYDLLRFLDLIELSKGDIDILDYNIVKNVNKYGEGKDLNHPCVLPKALIKRLIKVSSRKGDRVLDPFAGSFTVNLAAMEEGRCSIGVDMDPKYIKVGINRLKKYSDKKN